MRGNSFIKNKWLGLGMVVSLTLLLISFVFLFPWTLGQQGAGESSSSEEMDQLFARFLKEQNSITEINLSALYREPGQMQVFHPLLDLEAWSSSALAPTCIDKPDFVESRFSSDRPKTSGQESSDAPKEKTSSPRFEFDSKRALLEKKKQLDQFLNDNKILSEDFLFQLPYLDSSGSSFAWLLVQSGKPPFNTALWVQNHLSYFKPGELAFVLNKFSISDLRYQVLSQLKLSEIESMVRGFEVILSSDYLLVKNQKSYGFSPLSYSVYSKKSLVEHWRNEKYEITPWTSESLCLKKIGNACWVYNSNYSMKYLQKYEHLILGLLALIIFGLGVWFFRSSWLRQKELKQEKFALQVISHEFRTPVSSLLLMAERLEKIPNFSDQDRDLSLGISREVFRLQRIVEISRAYLQAGTKGPRFQWVEVNSLNEWMKDFFSEFNTSVEFHPLVQDQSLVMDPFWMRFVLSNLIENALRHGKKPVSVHLLKNKDRIQVSVIDQGHCEFASLDSMTKAFVKNSRSQGMGLGLNIVQSILEDWGGDLQYSASPTTFTLTLNGTSEVVNT